MLISFNSYGETFCLETDFELKDGLIHLKNEVKPFSGKFLCEDDDGEDLWKGSINNGKRDGKWTTWYDNGEKHSEENWDNGLFDGKFNYWYENGEKLAQEKFKNGKKEGRWREWYDDGQIKIVDFYKDGKLDGKSSKWDKNGQKTFEATYTDGKLDSNESLEENTSQLDAKTSNETESDTKDEGNILFQVISKVKYEDANGEEACLTDFVVTNNSKYTIKFTDEFPWIHGVNSDYTSQYLFLVNPYLVKTEVEPYDESIKYFERGMTANLQNYYQTVMGEFELSKLVHYEKCKRVKKYTFY